MKTLPVLALVLAALPLSAQAWDLRLEAPFAQGQDLPLGSVAGQPAWGSLGTGHGAIFTVSHRIVRVEQAFAVLADQRLECAGFVFAARLKQCIDRGFGGCEVPGRRVGRHRRRRHSDCEGERQGNAGQCGVRMSARHRAVPFIE